MPIVQSAELQGVLQSQALCVRPKGQGLSEKEKTKAKTQKEGRRIKKGRINAPFQSLTMRSPAIATPSEPQRVNRFQQDQA